VRVKPAKLHMNAEHNSLVSIFEAPLNVRDARKISDATHN
jgi:hypothetical protein